jgi:predicted nucleic acid-binding protein
MIKVFIDADAILDLLLDRLPFSSSSIRLFTLIGEKKVTAYTSPVVLANIYYISAKLVDKKRALQYIRKLLALLRIVAIDEKIMLLAANSSFKNFEDAIQYFSAKNETIGFLITRNKLDYRVSDLTVCTPDEYLTVIIILHQIEHSSNLLSAILPNAYNAWRPGACRRKILKRQQVCERKPTDADPAHRNAHPPKCRG